MPWKFQGLLGLYRFLDSIKTWIYPYLFFPLGSAFLGPGLLVYQVYPARDMVSLVVLALAGVYGSGVIYVCIYAWRGLALETKSFFLGLYYALVWVSLVLGFYRGTQGSLFLEDLPAHSFYRYLLALILALFFLLPSSQMPAFLLLPSTHYFYAFLGTWVENPWNKCCSFLITHWAHFPGRFQGFIFLHFLGVSLVPLVLVASLLFSIFVLQDLSFFLRALPLLGLTLVHALFWDYLVSFTRENLATLGSYVRVTYQGRVNNQGHSWVDVDNHDLSFTLLPKAHQQGYSLEQILDLWYPLASTLGLLEKLQEHSFFFYFSRFLLGLRLVGLFHLCQVLFPGPLGGSPVEILTLWSVFPCRVTRLFATPGSALGTQNFCTGKTTGSYYLKSSAFALAEKRSQGAFTTDRGNHSVNADPGKEKNGQVPVYNTNTSGRGTHENPSEKYSDVRVNGQPGEQFAMTWPPGSTMPREALGKIIEGSEKVIQDHGDQKLRELSSSYDHDHPPGP